MTHRLFIFYRESRQLITGWMATDSVQTGLGQVELVFHSICSAIKNVISVSKCTFLSLLCFKPTNGCGGTGLFSGLIHLFLLLVHTDLCLQGAAQTPDKLLKVALQKTVWVLEHINRDLDCK